MVTFKLPKNSKVRKGNSFDISEKDENARTFKIYRYSPDNKENPQLDSYTINTSNYGKMVLDALIYIKENIDSSLTFRRACREGMCGSCAMNINGTNQLACSTPVSSIKGDISIYPLPHMPVIKDLVVDLTKTYTQYKSIKPWIKNNTPPPEKERLQSIEASNKINGNDGHGASNCILCYSCSTSCPSYWWNSDKFLGAATLMQSYRWIVDDRDTSTNNRLEQLDDKFKLYRCHTIMNCTNTCPKGLNPAKSIAEIKKMLCVKGKKKDGSEKT